MTRDEAFVWADNPKFEETTRVHDWRNYVSDWLRELWPTIDLTVRAAIVMSADENAAAEEWD